MDSGGTCTVQILMDSGGTCTVQILNVENLSFFKKLLFLKRGTCVRLS